MILMLGCFRRVLLLALLLVGIALIWIFREPIERRWQRLGLAAEDRPLEPTPELAALAEQKLDSLARGSRDRPLVLTEPELQSLLEFRFAERLPPFVTEPHVELENGRVRLRVRLPTERLPRLTELGEVAGFLPDTTVVVATGQIIPLDSARVAFAVDEISAAKVPLPQRYVPALLAALGREEAPGLPADALALPLPKGATGAYVRGDSLVILTGPPATGEHDR
ncbi:MAG: hypothetical protein HY561_12795 [Gemmatimonadetes bacterium]|nr:hypothetical protein [Gemmatimonadota bacterium]